MKKTSRKRRVAKFQDAVDAAVIGMYRLDVQERAHAAREGAVSHKNFHVGGAAIIRLPDGTYRVIAGENYKNHSGERNMDTDWCAEMKLERIANELRARQIYHAIEAPPQADDATQVRLKVTIYCVHCRSTTCQRLHRRMPVTLINGDDRSIRWHTTVGHVLNIVRKKTPERAQ